MSYDFDLDLVPGPGSQMRVLCTGCRDYPQDDSSIVIGDDQGFPALRPNVAIIIIGLGFTLVVVVAFAVFAKFMRPHMNRQNNTNNASGGSRPWEDVIKDCSPVDAKAITRLPLVVYLAESFQGLKLDLECAVCLSQFEEGEELRLLPSCKHLFHPACIDGWLKSHPLCPLCRSHVLSSSWDEHTRPESALRRNFEASVAQESQRGMMEEDQLQSPSLEPHVEISVLERFEARFEALRGRCYGRKGKNCSGGPEPLPREGYLSELEKRDSMCDSSAFSSALGQRSNVNITVSEFHQSENCHLSGRSLCVSILPDQQEQCRDCPNAPNKNELAPSSCGDRIFDVDCSSSAAPSSAASATENTCEHR